jgi:hypothetical protein
MEYLLQLAASPTAWVALATLVVMEIVLGIDNLIFISILTNKLPEQHRQKARRVGIGMALILRLGLLSTIAFIVQLTAPVIELLRSRVLLERHDPDRRWSVPVVESHHRDPSQHGPGAGRSDVGDVDRDLGLSPRRSGRS